MSEAHARDCAARVLQYAVEQADGTKRAYCVVGWYASLSALLQVAGVLVPLALRGGQHQDAARAMFQQGLVCTQIIAGAAMGFGRVWGGVALVGYFVLRAVALGGTATYGAYWEIAEARPGRWLYLYGCMSVTAWSLLNAGLVYVILRLYRQWLRQRDGCREGR